jgi:hypothetical protein
MTQKENQRIVGSIQRGETLLDLRLPPRRGGFVIASNFHSLKATLSLRKGQVSRHDKFQIAIAPGKLTCKNE